jgi:RNA polymerase sigma-70 factor (ECF subfamily)
MGGVRILEWLSPAAAVDAAVDWDEVFRDQLPRVYNYLRYRGFDRPTAEDLTSVTFEKAWRARDRYRRDRAGVSTWLLSIARHAAIDHLRRPRRDVRLDDAVARDETTPETEALRAADRRRLAALVATLGEREREVLALKYGAGATNRAIARVTGLGESNVGTILHRTIAALRARWHEAEGGLP